MKTPNNKKQHKKEGLEKINGTLRRIEQQLEQATDNSEDSASDYDFDVVDNEVITASFQNILFRALFMFLVQINDVSFLF